MKAKDIFLKMGYEMHRNSATIDYCNDERDDWVCFTFDLHHKTLDWYSDNKPLHVNIEMFKAMLKQMEELKWIENTEEVTLSDLGYEKDLSEFAHFKKVNGEKIDSIEFIPYSKTFICEEERKPLIIDPRLFKAILNEVKKAWGG